MLTITHTWKCDVCGKADVEPLVEQRIDYCDVTRIPCQVPPGWCMVPNSKSNGFDEPRNFLVCPAHTITATHNGDVVTLKEGSA